MWLNNIYKFFKDKTGTGLNIYFYVDKYEHPVVGLIYNKTKKKIVTEQRKLRAQICKCLGSPEIDSLESILPAYLAWRAGRQTCFKSIRFLAPNTDFSKISAQSTNQKFCTT